MKDKLSLSQNIELAANENSNNYIAYDSTTGALHSSKETLVSAVSTKNETNRVYQMIKDEEVLSDLGTMAGTDSTLIVNGAGNEIKTCLWSKALFFYSCPKIKLSNVRK